MGYQGYVPRRPLSDFVSLIWLYQGDGTHGGPERILPTGAVDLVINLREGPLAVYRPGGSPPFAPARGPLVYGPHSSYTLIERMPHAAVLGVHFRPGAAALLHVPPAELHNRTVPLDELWGPAAHALAEQVAAAPTPTARLLAAERFLAARIAWERACRPAVRWAVRELLLAPRPLSVGVLSDAAGFSQRRFSQLFAEDIGLPPKLFQRVRRFQRALALADRADDLSWARVAAECGYYDQAHFIRDFHDFTGTSPGAYLAGRGPWVNHLPVDGGGGAPG